MINKTTQSRPWLKPTTEVDSAALNSPNEENPRPANVEVCMTSAQDESVVPHCHQHNLTDEGRHHAAEIAEKEAKQQAHLQKVVTEEKKLTTMTTKRSRSGC